MTAGAQSGRAGDLVDGAVLSRGDVQLWWAAPADFTSESLVAQGAVLPDHERTAAARFEFEADRKQALLTRLMVRQVLTRTRGGIAPDAWRFARTPFGRPVIANPGCDELIFSLSHTRSLVVCAVAAGAPLGVDIESLAQPAPLQVARRSFAPDETADILSAPLDLRARRFFAYWTLREAFIKAVGLGFSLPSASFSFTLRRDTVAVELNADLALSVGASDRWHFHLGDINPAHLLAVACSADAPLNLTFHAAGPLLRA